MLRHLILATMLAGSPPSVVLAESTPRDAISPGRAAGHGESHHHDLGLLSGAGLETKDVHDDAYGFAVGLEYEYRLDPHWGVVEGIGGDTLRDVLVVAPVSCHPGGHWRLFAGPGIEFKPKKEKFAFRLGIGYELLLTDGWTLAPEAIVDLIESGERTYVLGLALGYGF